MKTVTWQWAICRMFVHAGWWNMGVISPNQLRQSRRGRFNWRLPVPETDLWGKITDRLAAITVPLLLSFICQHLYPPSLHLLLYCCPTECLSFCLSWPLLILQPFSLYTHAHALPHLPLNSSGWPMSCRGLGSYGNITGKQRWRLRARTTHQGTKRINHRHISKGVGVISGKVSVCVCFLEGGHKSVFYTNI